ncbi:MAG: M28 family peptidase [Planctomycetota bacterium]|jgi:hypothetical protein
MNTQRPYRVLPWVAAFGTAFLLLGYSASAEEEGGLPSITEKDLLAHVKFLASPALKGRSSGMRGCNTAAKYIQRVFKKAKVPGGLKEGRAYHQEFPITLRMSLGARNNLFLFSRRPTKSYKVGKEFNPLSVSKNAATKRKPAFVGYGITAPEYEWDDYAGVDVKNRIVLCFRREPGDQDEKSPFKGKERTEHAQFIVKVLNAQAHGAKGIIIVNLPLATAAGQDKVMPVRGPTDPRVKIPAVFAKMDVAEDILLGTGKTLEGLQHALDDSMKPDSFQIKSKVVAISTDIQRRSVPTYNGRKGLGKVHPGADDNASGTAGVMEIAEAFALSGAPPKRSLLFIAFSGEERGLLGANFYAQNPLLPLDKIAAMLNLDMISRGPEGVAGVTFVGTWAKWREVLQLANQPLELSLRLGSMGSLASDHAPFYRAKIPCLFFAAGLHPDYHTPGDTWQKVNVKTMAGITKLAYLTCEIVANVPEKPVFSQPKSDRELPYLGITPGKEIKDMGFAIDSVKEGSPADKGGMRKGDILTEFDGRQIRTFQDLRDALAMHKAGDEVTLLVYRGGAEVELKVTLEKRGK